MAFVTRIVENPKIVEPSGHEHPVLPRRVTIHASGDTFIECECIQPKCAAQGLKMLHYASSLEAELDCAC